jgi:hypothetical protein
MTTGVLPYKHDLGKHINVDELKKNLIAVVLKIGIDLMGQQRGLKILKGVEKKRFEETVEKALLDQGKSCVGLSIIEKLTHLKEAMNAGEHKW